MGTTHSKKQKLNELSTEDITSFVNNLGDKYKAYGDAIASNAVDGDLLMEIDGVVEFMETLQCLDITNFLHRKKLTREWEKAKERTTQLQQSKAPPRFPLDEEKGKTISARAHTGAPPANLDLSERTSGTWCDASEITLDTKLSATARTSFSSSRSNSLGGDQPYCRPIVEDDEAEGAAAAEQQYPPLSISWEQKQAIEPLELPKSLEPEDPTLEPYFELAGKAMGELKSNFAMVNVLDVDMEPGVEGRGYNNLSSTNRAAPETPVRLHLDEGFDGYEGVCRKFILGSDEDFHIDDIPKEISTAFGWAEDTKYYGHVVKLGNLRIGSICIIIEETPDKETSLEQKKEALKVLAILVKGRLEKRAALMQRKRNLKEDLRLIKESGVDPVLAAPVGPLGAVTASQVAQRQNIFPYPDEPVQHPNGCPTMPQFTRRSSRLPAFQDQATEEERAHLPDSYFEDPAFHITFDVPLDRTPVGKKDMERVAVLDSMHLLQMDPLCEEARNIQGLVDLAGSLLKVDFVVVNLLTHQHSNLFFMTYPQDPWPEMEQYLQERFRILCQHPHTGQAFRLQGERATNLCNYTVMTPNRQSFVVHNVEQDQSLAFTKQQGGPGFYSGSPIVVNGVAVGSLCCASREPNTDFGRVEEIRQEQFAQLIGQEYETWALTREVQQLERERNLFLTSTATATATRDSAPEDYAALVFTSVQGIADLRQARPDTTNQAIELHNQIVSSKIAECKGYEVSTEDSSFHVAFADVVDAIQFCLKTQEGLHAAHWGSDLLTISQVKDVGAFRGLRVKMAIHCGNVESDKKPGKVEYSGETLHIAKNVESMAHGGQILITSDVWNVASHLVASTLGSPQVVDLGTHVVPSCSSNMQDGVTTKSILQLVPASLAHGFYKSRSLGGDTSANGRMFPRIKTKKSMSASFHDAPFAGNRVVLVCLDTSEVETMVADAGLLLKALSKRIGAILQQQHPDGYQCNDCVIAFADMPAAIRFGLAVQDTLGKEYVLDVSLRDRVRIGVHEGVFDTMGPNPGTGRAEYFGSVIDLAALVAKSASLGSVLMGKKAEEMDEFNLPPVCNGYMLDFSGICIEAFEEELAFYKCHPCKSWYDQIVDNRNGRNSLQSPWRGYY